MGAGMQQESSAKAEKKKGIFGFQGTREVATSMGGKGYGFRERGGGKLGA